MDQTKASEAAYIALFHANRAILNSTPKTMPAWTITAEPYLKAIAYNDYGVEDPKSCVLYALNNLHSWHGEAARATKALLNEAIKDA